MRYTEAKLSKAGLELANFIKQDTVEMIPNYDGTCLEPSVLSGFIPNLLVNGVKGVAVGYATKIPSHNITDVYDALIRIIDNTIEQKETSIDEVIDIIKAPDFPTHCDIIYTDEIKKAYKTGSGRCFMRATAEIEDNTIIFTSIPYDVVKSKTVESISMLAKTKKIEGIADVKDLSTSEGIRIVVDVKRGYDPNIILNNLYKSKDTNLYTSFSINMTALTPDKNIKRFNLLEILEEFLVHTSNVLMKRAEYNIKKDSKRLFYLETVLKCVEDKSILDQVIDLIKKSDSPEVELAKIGFTKEQCSLLMDMKLRLLSKASIEKLYEEQEKLTARNKHHNDILTDSNVMLTVLKEEFLELQKTYKTERKSEIIYDKFSLDYENTIDDKNVIISLTVDNCIKVVEEDEYRTQRRGGKGSSGDIIQTMITTNIKTDLMFFTNLGRCYVLRASTLPIISKNHKARSINNYLTLQENEYIVDMLTADSYEEDEYLLFVTKKGLAKRLSLENITKRKSGIQVINFNDGDSLVKVLKSKESDDVIAVSSISKGIRTSVDSISVTGRTAKGMKLMSLDEGESIVDAVITDDECDLFIISESGFGKTVAIKNIRKSNRGAKGVKLSNTKANEFVAGMQLITKENSLYLITEKGQMIKTSCEAISKTKSRTSKGVKMIDFVEEDDKIKYVIKDSGDQDEL